MNLTKELYFNADDSTTVKEITELANELLNVDWFIKIYVGREGETYNLKDLGWTFKFENTKSAAGRCSPRKKEIRLSMYLFEQNHNNANEWEEVLRHELAHAVDYCMRKTTSHDKVWKAVARKVLSNAERCYTSDDLQDKNSKYTVVCDTCGKETPRHKKSKRKQSCGDCGNGKYNEELILRWVQNY